MDATKVFKQLIERNPTADPEDLKAAFFDAADHDPALARSIEDAWLREAGPIACKFLAGEKLTATERALWKLLDGKPLTEAEQKLLDDR